MAEILEFPKKSSGTEKPRKPGQRTGKVLKFPSQPENRPEVSEEKMEEAEIKNDPEIEKLRQELDMETIGQLNAVVEFPESEGEDDPMERNIDSYLAEFKKRGADNEWLVRELNEITTATNKETLVKNDPARFMALVELAIDKGLIKIDDLD